MALDPTAKSMLSIRSVVVAKNAALIQLFDVRDARSKAGRAWYNVGVFNEGQTMLSETERLAYTDDCHGLSLMFAPSQRPQGAQR
jgi:hypothetical protein